MLLVMVILLVLCGQYGWAIAVMLLALALEALIIYLRSRTMAS